jgi:hypothetical protein
MEILSAILHASGAVVNIVAEEAGRRRPALRPTPANSRIGTTSWSQAICAVLVLVFPFAPSASGQVDEYRLKAAFLYNFTKFVEWPPESFKSPDEPIAICVLGRNPFGNVLNETVSGKVVGARAITVRQISDSQATAGCPILFVGAAEEKRFRTIAEDIKGCAVLSVGEAEWFSADGGIITFKLDHGSIRLEINVGAAERAHVRISSKLLALAQAVRRTP